MTIFVWRLHITFLRLLIVIFIRVVGLIVKFLYITACFWLVLRSLILRWFISLNRNDLERFRLSVPDFLCFTRNSFCRWWRFPRFKSFWFTCASIINFLNITSEIYFGGFRRWNWPIFLYFLDSFIVFFCVFFLFFCKVLIIVSF